MVTEQTPKHADAEAFPRLFHIKLVVLIVGLGWAGWSFIIK